MIYLKKSETSLKAVVKALLAQVKSAELDKLRSDVDNMSSGLDQSALERALINRLQEALAAAPVERGAARDLYGKDGLQVLLQDPYVSDHLRRPGALIPQLSKSILNDRDKDEKDRPLEFTVDDLPLDILESGKAAEVTQDMLQLLGVDADLQVAAVRFLLNVHLQTAVANATIGGVGRLQEAMLEVRREYARQGKEIVLLIEDFAVIQGFQRDLLDAVIEVGERDGKNDLAPIRTLMAVTSGYYESLPDTVRTRVQAATGYVYDLDAQFDPQERMGEISAFVGRYLNAARLGRERVEKHGEHEGTHVPNACEECAFHQQCHSAFGNSAEGHGLYPFNESALRRAIHARPAPGKAGAFNPRVVVGEVVKNVLVEHAGAITEARFPDPRFADEYRARRPADPGYAETREKRLSQAVRGVINELDPGDADRHVTFLEFWGDAPDEAVNLPEGMHEAFEIKRLDVKEVKRTPARPQTIDPADRRSTGTATGPVDGPPPSDDLPESVKRRIEHVESWAVDETMLHQGTANEIRTIIRNAVVERCGWNRPLMPEPSGEVLRRSWPVGSAVVSIHGALGEREATGSAPIQFTPSTENALFFEGLLLRAKAGRIQDSAVAWRRLAGYADRYQGRLQQETQRYLEVTDEQLGLGVRASLIGATLAGKALPGMKEAELLAVVFDEGQDWGLEDTECRALKWKTTLQKHLEARPGLIEGLRSGFGVSRGRGAVKMIDAARVLPMFREAVREWRWSTPDTELAPWIKKAVTGFADWEGLVDAQVTAHSGLLMGVRQFLPRGTSLTETIDVVSTAVREAREAGADDQPAEKYQRLQDLIEAARQQDGRAADRLEGDLTAAGEPGKDDRARILAAARDRGEDIAVIRDFLGASNVWLTNALEVARMRQRGVQQAAEAEVRDLLDQWAAIGGENQG